MKKIILFSSLLIFILFFTSFSGLDNKIIFDYYLDSNKYDISKIKQEKQYTYIKEIKNNLSGITYNKNTDTLFAITNSPRDIYELDKNGKVLREIKLNGFEDTEDLTYVKDNLFAILDEENNAFYIIKIDNNTKKISIKDSMIKFELDVKNFKNLGYEGISYNEKEDIFYIVNEKIPKKIVSVKGLITSRNIKIEMLDKIIDSNYYLSDFSGIYFDDNSNDLYLLSDESAILAHTTKEGKFRSYLDLDKKYIPQAEGVTIDKEGNVFIVSEPNIFLKIKKYTKT